MQSVVSGLVPFQTAKSVALGPLLFQTAKPVALGPVVFQTAKPVALGPLLFQTVQSRLAQGGRDVAQGRAAGIADQASLDLRSAGKRGSCFIHRL